MIVIDPEGLFGGDRLRNCSTEAQLHWPRLLLASDGFGRIEFNYLRIAARAYATFRTPPTEAELHQYFDEFAKNYLIFVYESDGRLWGQWDCPEKFLPRFKTTN